MYTLKHSEFGEDYLSKFEIHSNDYNFTLLNEDEIGSLDDIICTSDVEYIMALKTILEKETKASFEIVKIKMLIVQINEEE